MQIAQSCTAGALLVDFVQVVAFACQAACRCNGKCDHGAGPASCPPLPAVVSLADTLLCSVAFRSVVRVEQNTRRSCHACLLAYLFPYFLSRQASENAQSERK